MKYGATMLLLFLMCLSTLLTKHGFKLNQAAYEAVKVNHLILCIPGHQNLEESIIQLETYIEFKTG